MRIGRSILCLVLVFAAPVLWLQGRANAEMTPGPLFFNGFWQAEVSLAFLQAEQAGDGFVLAVRDGGYELAIDAWQREPLATDALFLIASQYRQQNDEEQLDQLLALGSSLDKRNRYLSALSLERAVQRGDYEESFAILDRIALANPRMVPELTASLKPLLMQEGSVEMLRTVLEREPVWVDQFWNWVPPDLSALQRMYELRQMTSIGTTPETDSLLVGKLVEAGAFSDALTLWRQTVGSSDNALLYRQDSQYPPISWQLVSTGQRALSARGPGRFELYSQRLTDGEVARQLVQLTAGQYIFSADVSPANDADDVVVELYCASDSGGGGEKFPLSGDVRWRVSGDCEAHWLVLSANAYERNSPLRVELSEITFRRAGR